MTSERIQRQVGQLLDQAENALSAGDWTQVRELGQRVLTIDPDNSEAPAFLAAAERGLSDASTVSASQTAGPSPRFLHPYEKRPSSKGLFSI